MGVARVAGSEEEAMNRLSISLLVTAALGSVGLAGCAASPYDDGDYSYSSPRVSAVYDDEDTVYAPRTWRSPAPTYSYSVEPSYRSPRPEPRWAPPAPSHRSWAPPPVVHAPQHADWAPQPVTPHVAPQPPAFGGGHHHQPPAVAGGGGNPPPRGPHHPRWPEGR